MQNHNIRIKKTSIFFFHYFFNFITMLLNIDILFRSVAQLVERRSPKPEVAGSSPSTPAINLDLYV